MKALIASCLFIASCATMQPVKYQVVESSYFGGESRIVFGATVTCRVPTPILIERLDWGCRKECERRVAEIKRLDGLDTQRDGHGLILGRTVIVCRKVRVPDRLGY
jgi:hypothetical protein